MEPNPCVACLLLLMTEEYRDKQLECALSNGPSQRCDYCAGRNCYCVEVSTNQATVNFPTLNSVYRFLESSLKIFIKLWSWISLNAKRP
jgi:hypothetical protein